MTKLFALTTAALLAIAPGAFAGDAVKGEKDFKKCKACHTITNGDEVIYKGGKTGPNLYGVIGRTAGTLEGYKYKDSIKEAGAAGLVWDAENLVAYAADPKKFLSEFLGAPAKSGMTFKMKNGEDVIAYLVSVNPAMEEGAAEETAEEAPASE